MNRRDLLLTTGGLSAALFLTGCGAPSGGSAPGRAVPAGQLADAVVPAPASGVEPTASPIGGFAADLTRRLAPKTTNLIWSPWSVAMVLAMVRDGAAGTTASEIAKVLGAGDDVDARLADGWRRMAHAQGTPLHAANSVWAQAGVAWKQPFLDKLAALSSSFKNADYAKNAAGVTDEINGWVAGQTADKITNLISEGMLTADTRMVLVNAVHFKASWKRSFDELGDRPFAAPGGAVSVPFLGTAGLGGWRSEGWTSAVIPCEFEEFDLVVSLPDDPKAAPSSAPQAALGLSEQQTASTPALVTLTMPAWKFRMSTTLNEQLIAAGMPTAFHPVAADFSGMTDEERLFLSLVVHEATIEVQATGIEAAAATAAIMSRSSAMAGEPISVDLNRPFAYALVHSATRTPLFVGQVADPTQKVAA